MSGTLPQSPHRANQAARSVASPDCPASRCSLRACLLECALSPLPARRSLFGNASHTGASARSVTNHAMALGSRFSSPNAFRQRTSSPIPRRYGMESGLVEEIHAIWIKAGYTDTDALRRLFLQRGNSDSTMPVFLEMMLSLSGLATSLFQAWQNSAPTEFFSAPKPVPLLDTVNTMEFFALMGEQEYQLWLWYALGGYFALALVMDVFIANVVSLARSHFGSDSLVFIETVKQAIGSTGPVTNLFEKAQSGLNALKLVEALTDIKLLLKRRADANGHPPKDLVVTLDRFALYLTIEKARDACDFKPEDFGLSTAEAAAIMRVFVKYDTDEDFRISRMEFMRLCKAEETRIMPREEIQLLAAMLDDNNDGYIDFTPFAQWWAQKRQTGSVLNKPDTTRVSRVLPRSMQGLSPPAPPRTEAAPPPRKVAPPAAVARSPLRHNSVSDARVSNGVPPSQRVPEDPPGGLFRSRASQSGKSLIESARAALERIGVSPTAKRSSSPHANAAERRAKEAAAKRAALRSSSPAANGGAPRPYETRISPENHGPVPAWRRRSSSPRDRVYGKPLSAKREPEAPSQQHRYEQEQRPSHAQPTHSREAHAYESRLSPEPTSVPAWRKRSSSPRDRKYSKYTADDYEASKPAAYSEPAQQQQPTQYSSRLSAERDSVPSWRRRSSSPRDKVYASNSVGDFPQQPIRAASPDRPRGSPSPGGKVPAWRRRSSSPEDRVPAWRRRSSHSPDQDRASVNDIGQPLTATPQHTSSWDFTAPAYAASDNGADGTSRWAPEAAAHSNGAYDTWNSASSNGASHSTPRNARKLPSYETRISGSAGKADRARSPKARVYPSSNGSSAYSSHAGQSEVSRWESNGNGASSNGNSNGSAKHAFTAASQGSRFAARRQESQAREAFKRSNSPRARVFPTRSAEASGSLSPGTYSTFDLAQRRFESVQRSAQPTWDSASENTLVPPIMKKKAYSYESRRSGSSRSPPPRRGSTFTARKAGFFSPPAVSAPSSHSSHSPSSLPPALEGCTMNDYVHQVSRRTDLVATVSAIKTACKHIAAKAARGSTQKDTKSVHEAAHDLLVHELNASGCVQRLSSAFEGKARECVGKGLTVVMQPLVPTSSLFPDNSPTGTLFAVYDSDCASDKDSAMQKGKRALAAGYCLYGSSTTLFLSVGDGVHGWTLDPVHGTFVCTHPSVQLPEHGRLLALDTAEVMEWPESLCQYAKTVCEGRGRSGTAYAMRFTGSIVADFHNILLIGGLCGCPYAEINLMHEAVPLAFLAEQAGGKATDGFGYRILNIEPIHREECMPAFMGCFGDVAELESYGTVRVEELQPPVSAFAAR